MLKTFNGKEYEITGLFVARNYTHKKSNWALFWALGAGRGIPEEYPSYKEAMEARRDASKLHGLPVVSDVMCYGGD